MGRSGCANHAGTPAGAECLACGKPICTPCTLVTPAGKFCSSECHILHRRGKKTSDPERSKGGGGKGVVLVLLLVLLALLGIHMFRDRSPILERLDLLEEVKRGLQK